MWCEPGVTVTQVNELLEPLGRKIGPDPESANAAMMGGVLANNSGGQQSGVERDPYSTLRSMEFVLANGHRYDTASPDDRRRFEADEPAIVEGLTRLRDRVRADGELVGTIRRKYRIKNVMGYGLRSFLDADEPIDILARLLIGSEGTLGFIASAVLATVPLRPAWAVGLVFFRNGDGCRGGRADARRGRRGDGRADGPGLPALVDGQARRPRPTSRQLPADATAVLFEYRAESQRRARGAPCSGAAADGRLRPRRPGAPHLGPRHPRALVRAEVGDVHARGRNAAAGHERAGGGRRRPARTARRADRGLAPRSSPAMATPTPDSSSATWRRAMSTSSRSTTSAPPRGSSASAASPRTSSTSCSAWTGR